MIGDFIDLLDQDIKDKSKADILAKGLVILQVAWIYVQCISRKAAGFPLTPLEIHTLVHAACALIMFALWFRKPLDVGAQSLVINENLRDAIALLLMRSPALGLTPYDILDPPRKFSPLPGLDHSVESIWLYRRRLYKSLIRERRSEATYLLFNPKNRDTGKNGSEVREAYASRVKHEDVMDFVVQDDARIHSQSTLRFSCHLTKDIRPSLFLRSGKFTICGNGLSVLLTGHSRAEFNVKNPPGNSDESADASRASAG